jgi:hypothetical protein
MWAGSNRRLNDLELHVLHATPAHQSTPLGRLNLLIFLHPCFKSQVHRQEFARFPVGKPAVLNDIYPGLPRFLLANSGKVLVLRHGHTSTRGVPRASWRALGRDGRWHQLWLFRMGRAMDWRVDALCRCYLMGCGSVLSWVKTAGSWCWPSTCTCWLIKECMELYIYSSMPTAVAVHCGSTQTVFLSPL